MIKFLFKSPLFFKFLLRFYPPFWFTGIKVKHISKDFKQATVVMNLRWYNRNYVNTHFGGSLFAMTDPFYMLMLMNILGPDYFVWDRSASIEYLYPGRGMVTAEFKVAEQEIETIKTKTASGEKYFADFNVEILDQAGQCIARVNRTIYIRLKQH